jgi:hypothetical protein
VKNCFGGNIFVKVKYRLSQDSEIKVKIDLGETDFGHWKLVHCKSRDAVARRQLRKTGRESPPLEAGSVGLVKT